MQLQSNIDLKNISRMAEIAEIYNITKQNEKSEKYHKHIIELCEKHPKNEKILTFKLISQIKLKKSYKSLQTTSELLNLNPFNIPALLNITEFLTEREYV